MSDRGLPEKKKNKKKVPPVVYDEEPDVKPDKPTKPYNNYEDACNIFKKSALYKIS